ncbi:hypothetical protein [Nocardioides bruguierae]|uniref:Uncharacterized protein n=1 Tax=Nocardioides bruguierae TaxID=2945102 RepID=A0A9X2IFS8_9ACTN|nr:hypothetical protein [Nocardioides bruguierae]MCM0621323.1 hypothetical protein [Nocardioides bruguierae]
MSTRRTFRAVATGGVLALVLSLTGGCSFFDPSRQDAEPEAAETTAVASADAEEEVRATQFTRDGTFQSHISVKGAEDVDFVYTLYPTKSTPRTNEWYPRGSKYFSFTFQAYDLARPLRAPFATKRRVYLSRIKVTSSTVTESGATQQPYSLDAVAKKVTFDPEPESTRYGMLISSPKGSFELRNQRIRPTSLDTERVVLTFTATVHVQTRAGGSDYITRTVRQRVPITIFPSTEKTAVADIPINAN